MDKNEQLEQLLPWHLAGSLEPDEQQEVVAWLKQSAEGREKLESLRQLAGAVRHVDPQALEPHPATGRLVNYAMGKIWKSTEREEIELHIEACPTCATEAGMARKAAAGELFAEAAPAPRTGLSGILQGWQRLFLHPAFAGLVLLALLVYPAWRGVQSMLGPGSEMSVTFDLSGGTFALAESSRGAPAEQLTGVKPAAGADHVILEVWFPVSGDEGRTYRMTLLDGGRVPVSGIPSELHPDTYGRIEAAVPLAGLKPGVYTLAVAELAPGSDQPPFIVEYPFRFLPSAGTE